MTVSEQVRAEISRLVSMRDRLDSITPADNGRSVTYLVHARAVLGNAVTSLEKALTYIDEPEEHTSTLGLAIELALQEVKSPPQKHHDHTRTCH